MIYFLVETLNGADGASRSALDFLHHLLTLNRGVIVVSRGRHTVPASANHGRAPRIRWLLVPSADAPDTSGLGYSPRKWLSWARRMLRHHWRRLRAAIIPRLFPPTLAIHNEFPYPGSYAHGILHMASKRMVIVHSSSECIAHYLRRRKTLTTASVAAELSRMHGLIFVSPQLRDDWAAIADIAHIPTWILSNTCREDMAAAVLESSRDATRASLELPQGAFVAVCVGYVHEGKGQDTLVAALPEMVRTVPNLLVVFVGEDTSQWAAELKNTIQRMSLCDRVRFTGQRNDPYGFIRASDMLIHPSRTEGQGLVLLEAMLLRTPILASNVGGIPSVVTHGETGWLVPPNDAHALADGFRTMAADASMRADFVHRAERAYWDRFSQRAYAVRFRDIFEHALDTRTLTPPGSAAPPTPLLPSAGTG